MAAAAAIPAVVGAAASASKGLFGQAQNMEGTGFSRSQLDVSPGRLAEIQRQQQAIQSQAGQLTGLAQQLQQQALQGAPTLQAINAPQFSNQLDPLSQGLVAQGQQAILGQASRQRADLARQFRAQPGVARALQAQTAAQAALQQNPLLFQAAQQQADRQIGQEQLRLSAQQAANQALLQQQAAEQAARGEALGFGQAGLSGQQQVMNNLTQLAQLLSPKVTQQAQKQSGRSGGLFSK